MAEEAKTYTQAEYDALVKERDSTKEHNEKLFREAKTAKDRAKLFDGLDPEETRTLKTRFAELEQQKAADKAGITSQQLEKMRSEIRADLEKEYTPVKSTAEQLAKENRELKLDTKVKDIMGKNGVRAERIDALFRLTGSEYDLTEDGVPMVKGKMGIEVSKYIAEDLSKQYPEFYVGTGSSGGGATKSTSGAGGQKTIQSGDQAGFMANLNDIAAGKTTVV